MKKEECFVFFFSICLPRLAFIVPRFIVPHILVQMCFSHYVYSFLCKEKNYSGAHRVSTLIPTKFSKKKKKMRREHPKNSQKKFFLSKVAILYSVFCVQSRSFGFFSSVFFHLFCRRLVFRLKAGVVLLRPFFLVIFLNIFCFIFLHLTAPAMISPPLP